MKASEVFENAGSVNPKHSLIDYFKRRWIMLDDFPEIDDCWRGFLMDIGYSDDEAEDASEHEYQKHSDEFYEYMKSRGWLRHFRQMYGRDLPAWMWFDFIKVLPRTTWVVHFTDYANEIATTGFTKGVEDLDNMAFTFLNGKRDYQHSGPGYNFGIQADDEKLLGEVTFFHASESGYGRNAVLFQTGGVLAYHDGDKYNTVIFWGPSVNPKRIIPLTRRESGWWTGAKRKSTYLPALVDMIRQDISANPVARK